MKITPSVSAPTQPAFSARLRDAATALEATFLAEMLKSAGLGKARQSFGGGAGEDQFASFMIQHQSQELARSGGVGLSEILFRSMMEKANGK